jgi:hypothetical protein
MASATDQAVQKARAWQLKSGITGRVRTTFKDIHNAVLVTVDRATDIAVQSAQLAQLIQRMRDATDQPAAMDQSAAAARAHTPTLKDMWAVSGGLTWLRYKTRDLNACMEQLTAMHDKLQETYVQMQDVEVTLTHTRLRDGLHAPAVAKQPPAAHAP